MLTALQLGNFKSWREVNAPLAPITGFFGTNSSGKTSLLQALLLMKQTTESADQQQVLEFGNEKTLVDVGGFNQIIFQKDVRNKLFLGVDYFTSSSVSNRKLKFISRIVLLNEKVILDYFKYDGKGSTVGFLSLEEEQQFKEYLNGVPTRTQKFYRFFENQSKEKEHEITDDLEFSFEQAFSRVSYLGPLRDFPKRFYTWSGAAPSNVGKQGENTIAALLAARVGGNKVGDTPLEEYIALQLKQLGLIDSFRLEELREGTNIFRVLVRRTPESPEVSLTDVGFGVSQVLPVLVLCYYVPEGSTVILEQPELHLHPSVQSGLADVFIDAYKKRGVQIIIESHSEHLLRRLQRRIAEEQIETKDVNLYFCSLEHGESKLEALQLDEYGQIHNYPKDFFGDEFGEIAATTKRIMERKKAKIST
jgi:predicted ATPase